MRLMMIITALLLTSCSLSFKNTSISPEVEHFYVGTFDLDAFSAPPTLAIEWTERLRDKILQDTRLRYEETDPHISFTGSVTRYAVESVAPQQGEGAALNRLEIAIRVDYDNAIDDQEWTSTFTFFSDFDRTQNLADIEDELIEIIYDQILEDVFNKAFANW